MVDSIDTPRTSVGAAYGLRVGKSSMDTRRGVRNQRERQSVGSEALSYL